MAPRSKKAAPEIKVPQSKEEVTAMIAEFGVLQRLIQRIESEMQEQLAKLKEDAEKEAAPLAAKMDDLFRSILAYCTAHRESLTEDGKTKTVRFGTGDVSWRWNPPKVRISGGDETVVLLILAKAEDATERGAGNARDYLNFLRKKVEIDRDAMLKLPDLARTIEGVTIGRSAEMFEVRPFAPELTEAS